jgi:hypothetical protein
MYFMVEELHGDWREIGGMEAEREGEAVAKVCRAAGMYRARLLGTRIWRYFWLSVGGELERMDD